MTRGLIPRGCHIDYTVTYQRQPRADPIDNKTDPIDDKHYGRVCWKNFSFVYIFFPFWKIFQTQASVLWILDGAVSKRLLLRLSIQSTLFLQLSFCANRSSGKWKFEFFLDYSLQGGDSWWFIGNISEWVNEAWNSSSTNCSCRWSQECMIRCIARVFCKLIDYFTSNKFHV